MVVIVRGQKGGKKMNDLISRQAAIDALWKALYEYEDKTEKQFQESEDLDVGDWILHRIFVQNMSDIDRQTILNLPSAQPEQRWIPCSERLPEERDWYLGIFKEPDTGWINPIPFICDYLLGTKTKATTKEGWILKGHTDREEYIDYYFNLECVAWMPLPQLPKGE